MKIIWTQEKKDNVIQIVENWFMRHDAFAGEVIAQSDECITGSVDLAIDICETIEPEHE